MHGKICMEKIHNALLFHLADVVIQRGLQVWLEAISYKLELIQKEVNC